MQELSTKVRALESHQVQQLLRLRALQNSLAKSRVLLPSTAPEFYPSDAQAIIWQALELQGSAEAALTQEFSHRVTQALVNLSDKGLQQSGQPAVPVDDHTAAQSGERSCGIFPLLDKCHVAHLEQHAATWATLQAGQAAKFKACQLRQDILGSGQSQNRPDAASLVQVMTFLEQSVAAMETEILQHYQARAGLQHVQALMTNAEELQQGMTYGLAESSRNIRCCLKGLQQAAVALHGDLQKSALHEAVALAQAVAKVTALLAPAQAFCFTCGQQSSFAQAILTRPLHFQFHTMKNLHVSAGGFRLSLAKQMADMQQDLCSKEEAFIAIEKLVACQLEQDSSDMSTVQSAVATAQHSILYLTTSARAAVHESVIH
ncbi:hypothetical protein WJX74_007477 [Apatococcus lobatus]|uniref:Uncharacterized protein n=1 Tax=Apatococcus lobatus TaxID=904363 RepID=A0AAW1S400_9CHLO